MKFTMKYEHVFLPIFSPNKSAAYKFTSHYKRGKSFSILENDNTYYNVTQQQSVNAQCSAFTHA